MYLYKEMIPVLSNLTFFFIYLVLMKSAVSACGVIRMCPLWFQHFDSLESLWLSDMSSEDSAIYSHWGISTGKTHPVLPRQQDPVDRN
jgi:hypothetical protein